MRLSLMLGALALGWLTTGCGTYWNVVLPECQWVEVSDVGGTWISESYEGQAIGPLGSLDRRTWVLEEESTGLVVGVYTETYLEGTLWSDELTGSYDAEAGLLVLAYESPIWGFDTRYYRFTSEFEMYEAEADPADTFCTRPIQRQP